MGKNPSILSAARADHNVIEGEPGQGGVVPADVERAALTRDRTALRGADRFIPA